MTKTFTFDSKTKNALFVHVLNMIIMTSKAVGFTVFFTSIVFKVGANLSYISIFFPKQDFLLAMLYLFLSIFIFSTILGIIFSFGETKEEIIKSYEKKDAWIWVNFF